MVALKIREAAGAIFESEVQRIRDDEVSVIVEKWQHRRGYLSLQLPLLHTTRLILL